jgi:hypothetical protein
MWIGQFHGSKDNPDDPLKHGLPFKTTSRWQFLKKTIETTTY